MIFTFDPKQMPQKRTQKTATKTQSGCLQNFKKIRKLGKVSTLCAADHPLAAAVLKPGAVERVAPPKRQPELKNEPLFSLIV